MEDNYETVVAVAEGKFRGDNCQPRFHLKSVKMEAASKEKARDVYQDFEYVEIQIPGQRRSQIDRKVRDEDKRRWPVQYAAWKAGRELPLEGTPLEKWTLISPAEIDNLKFCNVRTVEVLAKLTDQQCQECGMGVRKLRQLAQEWLAQADGNVGLSKMSGELEAAKAQISDLQGELKGALTEIRKLKDQLTEEEDEPPPPPTRRRRRTAAATELENP